ncbi:MAG: VWA domain-containing protein [Gammaproteobacteria bacterium]|nr:VWA domain-containing protein [Gammaproteobacteria bacterium]
MKDKHIRKRDPTNSSNKAVDQFLNQVAKVPPAKTGASAGRLIFGMDATASREATWDQASHIQAEMFADTAALGGLEIQLCYYRGFGEFSKSQWFKDSARLLKKMTSVFCLGGRTQLNRILQHCVEEATARKIHAVVFVGDAMEEAIDDLCHLAGKLGILNVPVFLFQEGYDPLAEQAFRQIARLTHGAYCRFDSSSPKQLKEMLGAVAIYAAGGRKALEDFSKGSGSSVQLITQQLKKG